MKVLIKVSMKDSIIESINGSMNFLKYLVSVVEVVDVVVEVELGEVVVSIGDHHTSLLQPT